MNLVVGSEVLAVVILVKKEDLKYELKACGVVQVEAELRNQVFFYHGDHLDIVSVAALVIPLLLGQNNVLMHLDGKHEGDYANELVDLDLNLVVLAQIQVHVDDGCQDGLLLEVVFFPQLFTKTKN